MQRAFYACLVVLVWCNVRFYAGVVPVGICRESAESQSAGAFMEAGSVISLQTGTVPDIRMQNMRFGPNGMATVPKVQLYHD